MLRLKDNLLGARTLDGDFALALQPSGPDVGRDFIFLEQEGDAIGQPLNDAIFAGEHGGEIEAQLTDLDTVLVEVRFGLSIQFARVEQRLAGNAADVETGAAQGGTLLDAGDAHAQLRRANGGHITTRPRANHDEIITLRHHLPRKNCIGERPAYAGWFASHQPAYAGRSPCLHFQHQSFGAFEALLDAHQKADRLATVDQTMIVRKRQVHHRSNDHLIVNGHGALLDTVHAEDAALRRIEDWGG